jgi:hypothetical protein
MSTQGKQWMLDSRWCFRLNGSMPMGRIEGLSIAFSNSG